MIPRPPMPAWSLAVTRPAIPLRSFVGFLLLAGCTAMVAAAPLDYYLPRGMRYEATVTQPSEYVGFDIGDRHLRHHELAGYLAELAEQSDRIQVHTYGRTYGRRSLHIAVISSPENLARLESVREAHLAWTDPHEDSPPSVETLPAVIWMGYSVHGNEASAGNAAALVAYHLAAGQGPAVERLLENTVILLDPCLNPDGFDRFAQWVNSQRGEVVNPDSAHREHHEPWPGGRTNYYWFDLNRDWLPVQHPESQGRLQWFHDWKPNVVLDYHEMGSSSTYFFQPGVPERGHPLIPTRNVELTRRIAEYHADALDRAGSLYFTEEMFDDFYMGKGSTYPDLHGSIGILFEQGSVRGHAQETPQGTLDFSFAVRNQFLTSLSSLRATADLRQELLEFQRQFYRDALALARRDDVQGYVVRAPRDPARLQEFVRILRTHDIDIFHLAQDVNVEGKGFPASGSYVIPAEQAEYRFLEALFERRTEFRVNEFYDVSAWTLPLAFDLDYAEVGGTLHPSWLGQPATGEHVPSQATLDASRPRVGYLIEPHGYFASRTVYRLLAEDIHVRVALEPFQAHIEGEVQPFDAGTYLVPLGLQESRSEEIAEHLRQAIREDQVTVHGLDSGMTPVGVDAGSNAFAPLEEPRILLLVGDGVRSYEAGQVWHVLDQRFGFRTSLVETDRLDRVDMAEYNTLILAGGSYGAVSSTALAELDRWLTRGGTLIALGSSATWVASSELATLSFRSRIAREAEPPGEVERRPYADARRDAAVHRIAGAIFHTRLDPTHPLSFGFSDTDLPVFRNHTLMLEPSTSPYSTPGVYAEEPLLAGYASPENQAALAGSATALVQPRGRGRVIVLLDDPNFRAFWWGTNRLFLNAILLGPVIQGR